ncbi:lipopolysaccharide biosynthesis protein [Devosia sp. PTR5]|uniref:Lipopolysaccharide biosynthesis protein n=1 Tax=Devosia oryzisoli TaxID=2774138 RepID=A0A927IUJ4_9HYPH|nr:lipopolysaccharide biosynthesis protein [Devosia oryzisoli]MBD8066766.1 lipopolysaccharide biosynthesis protein [Devosia oryzisoli]
MLLRSTFIYAPAILFTRLSALLLVAVATRLVDQTEYGLLTLVVTIGEMTDIAVTNWLRISLLRLGGKGDVSRGSLWLAGRVLILTTVLGVLLALVVAHLVAPERATEFGLAVAAYLAAGAISRFALTVLQMQQRHSTYSLLEFARAVLQLALPIAAAFLLPRTFFVLSLGSSLAVLLSGTLALGLALKHTVPGPARFTVREFVGFGVPLVVMALVSFGVNNGERLFLNAYYDAGAVAVFAVAFALARQPIDTVANAVQMGAFPELVSRFDTSGPGEAARYLGDMLALMLRLCLPVAALLMALSGPIAELVLPAGYHGQVEVLFPIIVLSVLFSNTGSFVFANMIHAHKRPWLLVWIDGAASVATIGLSIALIPSLAETGAALALAGGTGTSLVVTIFISRRLTPIPVPWADMAVSAAMALGVGVTAYLAANTLKETWPIVQLGIGGVSGGLVFLGLNALAHPNETRAIARRIRARLAIG